MNEIGTFEDKFGNIPSCFFTKLIKEKIAEKHILYKCCCIPNKNLLICQECIKCHKCPGRVEIETIMTDFECDCNKLNHKITPCSENSSSGCIHDVILKYSPERKAFLNTKDNLYYCEYCRNECFIKEKIDWTQVEEEKNVACSCKNHNYMLKEEGNLLKYIPTGNYNLFKKNEKTYNYFIKPFEELNIEKLDYFTVQNINLFMKYYEESPYRKYFIPHNYFKGIIFDELVNKLFSDDGYENDITPKINLMYISFLTDIKSVFLKDLNRLGIQTIINMSPNLRKHYLKLNIEEKYGKEFIKSVNVCIEKFLNYYELSSKVNLQLSDKMFIMLKFFAKYNFLSKRVLENFFIFFPKLLEIIYYHRKNESEHKTVDIINGKMIRMVFYVILHFRDKFHMTSKIEMAEKRLVMHSYYNFLLNMENYTSINFNENIMIRFGLIVYSMYEIIIGSFQNRNKLSIPASYNDVFKDDQFIFLSNLNNEISKENMKYLNNESSKKEYLKRIFDLYEKLCSAKDISKETVQNICTYSNFYTKYNEFIFIFSQIEGTLSENKRKKFYLKLSKILDFISLSIDQNCTNLILFFSINVKIFIDLHYNLGKDFLKFLDSLFLKNYIKMTDNMNSLAFFRLYQEIFFFDNVINSKDIFRNTYDICKFLNYYNKLKDSCGDFFAEEIFKQATVFFKIMYSNIVRLKVDQSTYKEFTENSQTSKLMKKYSYKYWKSLNYIIISSCLFIKTQNEIDWNSDDFFIYQGSFKDNVENIKAEIEILKLNYFNMFYENMHIDKSLYDCLYNGECLLRMKRYEYFSIFKYDANLLDISPNNSYFYLLNLLNYSINKFHNMINQEQNKKYSYIYFQTSIFIPLKILSSIIPKWVDINIEHFKLIYQTIQKSLEIIINFYRLNISDFKKKSLIINEKLSNDDISAIEIIYNQMKDRQIDYQQMEKVIEKLLNVITILTPYTEKSSKETIENPKDLEFSSLLMDLLKDFNLKDHIKDLTVKNLLKEFFKTPIHKDVNIKYHSSPKITWIRLVHQIVGFCPEFKIVFYGTNNSLKEKYPEFFESFHNYMIFIFIFGYFRFYLHRRMYTGIKLNDFIIKFILNSLKFLQGLNKGESRLYADYLFNFKVGVNSLNKFFYEEEAVSTYTDEYKFADMLFFINCMILESIMRKPEEDYHLLVKIYVNVNKLLILMIEKISNKATGNYFFPFKATKNKIVDEKLYSNRFYYLDLFINTRKCFDNSELNTHNDIVKIMTSNFEVIITFLSSNLDQDALIIDLMKIFPTTVVLNSLCYYFESVLRKYKIITTEKLGLNKDFAKEFIKIYKENEHIYSDNLFNLCCQLYKYLRIINDYTGNIIPLIVKSELSNDYEIENEEFESLSKTYKNPYLDAMESVLRNCKPKYSSEMEIIVMKTFSKIVISCEIIFFNKTDKSNNDIKSNGTLINHYFVQKPILFFLDKINIIQKLIEQGCESINQRSYLLFDTNKYYMNEIKFKKEFIDNGKYNKKLLTINYNIINYVNIIMTIIQIFYLLFFIDQMNKSEPKMYALIRFFQIFQIIINTVFVFLFRLSKYYIYIKLDESQQTEQITRFEQFQMYYLSNFLLHDDISFLVSNIILGSIITYNPHFFSLICLQLLAIIKYNPTIKQIFTAFTMTFDKVIAMIVFLAIIILIYANYAYLFLKTSYILDNEEGNSENICGDLFHCFIYHFDTGVRSQGGIGDSLSTISFHTYLKYTFRYIGDFTFFICIVLLILNMINGIIITTFSQIREDNEKRLDELRDKCYICGVPKSEFEESGFSYNMHILNEHNYFNYIKLFIVLSQKGTKHCNIDELFILECLKNRNLKCLPIKNSLSLGQSITH